MNLKISFFVAAFAGILGACQNSPMSQGASLTQEQITEKRDKVLNMADRALAKLYAQNPGVRKEIEQAAGYGVFDVTAINAVLLVGSRGPGVIFDNKTKKHTFMQSMRAGTGPGLGYQELYRSSSSSRGRRLTSSRSATRVAAISWHRRLSGPRPYRFRPIRTSTSISSAKKAMPSRPIMAERSTSSIRT